jgi:hypothetical protein
MEIPGAPSQHSHCHNLQRALVLFHDFELSFRPNLSAVLTAFRTEASQADNGHRLLGQIVQA